MSEFEDRVLKRYQSQRELQPPEPHAYATGSTYVDQGAGTAQFLSDEQRVRVVALIQGRVIDARSSFLNACTQLRVDELLARDDHGLLLEALLEIVGGVALLGVGRLFSALKAAGERVAREAELDYRTASSGWRAVAAMDARSASSVSKSVVSAVKRHALSSTPQTEGIQLIDMLADQSGLAFQIIREQAPVGMDDAQLLVMFDAFSAINHTVSAYRDEIGSKIERYKQTQIGDVGAHRHGCFVHERWKVGGTELDTRLVGPRDTRVYALDVAGERHYAIYRCELSYPGANGAPSHMPFAGNDAHFAAPMAYPSLGPDGSVVTDRDFRFVQWIPREFEDAAVRANITAWGTVPTVRNDLLPWSKP